MRHKPAVRCLACLLTLALSQAAFSYEASLSERSVREAYFLGQRNDDRTALFLESYRRHLPAPKVGPHISRIELLTPYTEVVELSRQRTAGYSAQQAARDYRKRPALVRVRVDIELTNTYGYLVASQPKPGTPVRYSFRPAGFWKDFRMRLSQNGHPIEPEEVQGRLTTDDSSAVTGAIVTLTYAAGKISSEPTLVEVFPPEGQSVAATFDLEKLR